MPITNYSFITDREHCPNKVDIHCAKLSGYQHHIHAKLPPYNQQKDLAETAMSWIVRDACLRLRVQVGCYRWDQWQQAADDLGLIVAIVDRCPGMPACIVDNVMIIEWTSDSEDMARIAWHEVAHHVLHAGDHATWAAMPNGSQLVAKWERQAEEFVEIFPRWE